MKHRINDARALCGDAACAVEACDHPPARIAGIVGEPGALAQILALVAMGFVAYAFVVFTRSFNTAGSVYAFNATALGPGYGFVSAWLLLLVYTSFAAGVYAATAAPSHARMTSELNPIEV